MFSEPVIGERFFGREEILELLNKRVLALKDGYRQNIALTGPSLAGKSSIILHFLQTIRNDDLVPVYIEVVNEPFRAFANRFIATVLYNALSKKGESVGIEMQELIERSQKALPKTLAAAKQVNSHIERGDFDEAYQNMLGLTSVVKEETGYSCVVILDEFDNLERLGVKNPFLGFGKVIMVQKDTMYIVSSSRNEAIKKIISEKLSLLFGNFEVIRVANFDSVKACDFIDTKLAGFEMENALKKFLIAFTDGNPFYLGRILITARDLAIERMSSYIDEKTLERSILELVYDANGTIHQYLLSFLMSLVDSRSRDLCMSILTAIASGHNTQPEMARILKIKKGEISKAVARLLEQAILSKSGVFYQIEDAMLEFWIRSVYERRKNLLVDGTFKRTDLFARDISNYIKEFVAESEKKFLDRVAELFGAFSNELVTIDSKHIRMPHFTKVEIKNFLPDLKPLIAASFRGNYWMVQAYEDNINENDIINYIRNIKSSGIRVANKVIVPLKGIDENARLLAKELKISIWDSSITNRLLDIYGRKRIIVI